MLWETERRIRIKRKKFTKDDGGYTIKRRKARSGEEKVQRIRISLNEKYKNIRKHFEVRINYQKSTRWRKKIRITKKYVWSY